MQSEASDVSLATAGFFEWEAANPLLAGIPCEMTFEKMAAFLAYDPADVWKGETIPDGKRRGTAYKVKDLFVPVARCVHAVQRLHQGLLNGLMARDARLPQNRAAVYERAAMVKRVQVEKTTIAKLPWFSEGAPGFVFSGSTGEGKSMLIERYLAGIPQVLIRQANEECGWKELKQLVWLKVSMPSNGGRLGLLMEMVKGMDKVLGTDYERELRARGTTIDVQLVLVLGWLSLHRCGLLVIEEAQERTAKVESFGTEFLTYFLKILNWGIPTLLIGNPKALAIVETFVQDERRFAEAWIDFLPISDPEDPEWKDALVPALWSWRVTKEPDQPIEDLHVFLWKRTGGHRAALSLLRREANIAALDNNAESITLQHVIMGFHSVGFRKRQKYIASLIKQDLGTLETYKDAPVQALAKRWNDERKAAEKAGRKMENEDRSANPSAQTTLDATQPIAPPRKKRAPRTSKGLAPTAPQVAFGTSPPDRQMPASGKSGCDNSAPEHSDAGQSHEAGEKVDSPSTEKPGPLGPPEAEAGSPTALVPNPAPPISASAMEPKPAVRCRPPSHKALFKGPSAGH